MTLNKSALNLCESRLRILFYILPILTLLILIRLFYWQIIRGPKLASLANRQHQDVVILNSSRGDIFDSNNNLLAGTQILYHLYAYKPQFNKDLSFYPHALAEILTTHSASSSALQRENEALETQNFLSSRLSMDSNWISLKHYLTRQQKEAIQKLDLVGLGFEEEPIRFYPEASISAHVLGFVGDDLAGQPQGYFGLEGFYDRQLRGREGRILAEKDALGNPILIGRFNLLKNISGRSIVTTIDKNKQYLVERCLLEGIDRYQAKAGNVILMETASGKILAMASLPNYDPSHFQDFAKSSYRNPNVADLFEPGSIFKILVMAAGINEGLIDQNTVCDDCAGPLNIGQFTIKTWNEEYHPNATMTDILVHSDNVGMVFVAKKLGADKFTEYLKSFGLGSISNIQLQEETTGNIKNAKDLKEIDLATQSFGQGIAITPIQMVAAANTIANNGIYTSPTIVDHLITDGKSIPTNIASPRRVLNPQTAQMVRQMMADAVNLGEAKWAKPKDMTVAGKTGTAQIPIQGHYDPAKTIASFIGFYPAKNPKYTMLVSLTEPQTSPWGSETAAPLWFNIASKINLTY